MSSEPFISNDLFILYSDIVFDKIYPPEQIHIFLKKILTFSKVVLFVNTNCLNHYIPWLLTIMVPYVLITTCCGDECIPYEYFPPQNSMVKELHDKLLAYPKMIRWMTKNPSICHPKLTYIPMGPKWQYQSWDFFGEDKTPILDVLHRHCTTPSELFYSEKSKLVYVNFDVNTTMNPFYIQHTNIRNVLLKWCKDQGFEKSASSTFEGYLKELKEYKFCMSPPGCGIDTHRAFESLMVGTIPIMISSPLNSMYEDLPVLIVNRISMITQSYLEEQYERIKKKTYNFEKLYAPYWKRRVHSDLNRDYESQSLVC